jgi:hypothetical protein
MSRRAFVPLHTSRADLFFLVIWLVVLVALTLATLSITLIWRRPARSETRMLNEVFLAWLATTISLVHVRLPCGRPNGYIRRTDVKSSLSIAFAMAWLRKLPFAVLYSVLTVRSVFGVVFGPIGTDRPAPAGGSVANTQPPSSFFQGFSPPYPTNDWWVGYGAGNGTAYVTFYSTLFYLHQY